MLLEARNLHVGYGDATAIWEVSLDVDAGEIVSVIGPNGAGKTTLINAMAGLLRCRGGQLRFDGADMTRVRAHDYCGHGIALVPEGRRLFVKMSVEENLELGCYLVAARAHRQESLERVYGLFPILRDKRRQLAGELSGGQQQMVAIARALLNDNPVLLVDEPTKGLAPLLVTEVAAAMERAAELATVLLVEQNLAVVERVAQQVVVLDGGRVVHAGPAAELMRDRTKIQALLGVSGGGGA
jgi:branched-chain amino acid transport system ATP-binding protein